VFRFVLLRCKVSVITLPKNFYLDRFSTIEVSSLNSYTKLHTEVMVSSAHQYTLPPNLYLFLYYLEQYSSPLELERCSLILPSADLVNTKAGPPKQAW